MRNDKSEGARTAPRSKKSIKLKRDLAKFTKKRLRRRNTRFWLLFLVLAILLGYGGYRVYSYMHTSLINYEAAQAHTLRAVVADAGELFTSRDYARWFEYEDKSLLSLEAESDFVEYAKATLDDTPIAYYQTRSDSPDAHANSRKYVVTAGNRAIAEFSVRTSGDITDCGIFKAVEHWELDAQSIKVSLVEPREYTLKIPKTATLTLNGSPVPAEYIIEDDIRAYSHGYLPGDAPDQSMCVYRVEWAYLAPEFIATDINGAQIRLGMISENEYCAITTQADDDLRPQFEEQAVNMVKDLVRYIYYTGNVPTQNNVLAHMEPNSPASDSVKNIDPKWGRAKSRSVAFDNIYTDNYMRYGDNAFSCVVRFETTIVLDNNRDEPITESQAYTLFMHKTGIAWKVYSYAMYDLTEDASHEQVQIPE